MSSCHTCKLNKKVAPKPRAALGAFHAGLPLERVHFDILGPLPESSKGNVYILVIVDQFTKWVESYALPDQKAESIAEKLVFEFISRFGCPLEIHTDQGKNVDGAVISSICKLLQIRKTRTTPYHPSSNGQCERYNRTILQMVRCFLEGKSKDWDVHLPILMGAIRSVPNANTGFSPNLLMLGREVWGPEKLIFGIAASSDPTPPEEFVSLLRQRMEESHKLVRASLKRSQAVQKRTYDTRIVQHPYQPGDLVLRRDWAGKKGESPKLRPLWKGPFLVIKCVSSQLVQIQGKRGAQVIHHDNVLPYRGGNVPLWMRRLRHNLEKELSVGGPQDPFETEGEMGLVSLFQEVNEKPRAAGSVGRAPVPRVQQKAPQSEERVKEVREERVKTRVGRETRLPAHLRGMVT